MTDTILSQHSKPRPLGNTPELEPAGSRFGSILLLCETQSTNHRGPQKIADLIELDLLRSPSQLVGETHDRDPHFIAIDADACSTAPHPVFDSSSSAFGDRPILVTPPGSIVRVNGLPVPVVAPLELGDQVSIEPGAIYHVSRRNQTSAIPTPSERIGEQCPLCMIALTAETRVVLCSSCGTPRHLEGEEIPEAADRLSCAAFGSCPVCDTAVPTKPTTFAFVPDGFIDDIDDLEESQ